MQINNSGNSLKEYTIGTVGSHQFKEETQKTEVDDDATHSVKEQMILSPDKTDLGTMLRQRETSRTLVNRPLKGAKEKQQIFGVPTSKESSNDGDHAQNTLTLLQNNVNMKTTDQANPYNNMSGAGSSLYFADALRIDPLQQHRRYSSVDDEDYGVPSMQS